MRARFLIIFAILVIILAGCMGIYIDKKKDSDKRGRFSYNFIDDTGSIKGETIAGRAYVRVDVLRESHPGSEKIARFERELEELRAEQRDYIKELNSSLGYIEKEYEEAEGLILEESIGIKSENISSWDSTVKMASQRLRRFENITWEDVEERLFAKLEEFNATIDERMQEYRDFLNDEMRFFVESTNRRYNAEILDLHIKLATNDLAPFDKKQIEERLACIHREIMAETEEKERELDSKFKSFLEHLMDEMRREYKVYKDSLTEEAMKKIEDEREDIGESLSSVKRLFEDYDEKILSDRLGRERINSISAVIKSKIERIDLEYKDRIFDIISRKESLYREIDLDVARSIQLMEQRIGANLRLVEGGADPDAELLGAADLTSEVLEILIMGV